MKKKKDPNNFPNHVTTEGQKKGTSPAACCKAAWVTSTTTGAGTMCHCVQNVMCAPEWPRNPQALLVLKMLVENMIPMPMPIPIHISNQSTQCTLSPEESTAMLKITVREKKPALQSKNMSDKIVVIKKKSKKSKRWLILHGITSTKQGHLQQCHLQLLDGVGHGVESTQTDTIMVCKWKKNIHAWRQWTRSHLRVYWTTSQD